jgi:hypothetical protein
MMQVTHVEQERKMWFLFSTLSPDSINDTTALVGLQEMIRIFFSHDRTEPHNVSLFRREKAVPSNAQ